VTAWAGRSFDLAAIGVGAAALVVLLALRKPTWSLVAVVSLAGAVSGTLSSQRDLATLESAVPEGIVEVYGVAIDDPRPGATGFWFLLDPDHLRTRNRDLAWDGPPLLVNTVQATKAMAGDRLAVSGRLQARPGAARGDPYAGRIDARTIESIEPAGGFFRVANLIRGRVENQLSTSSDRPAAALLSGFLIGDIRELPRPDGEALRRAGLSHYVAVSGSNVALFLMLWWFILGPLGFGTRRRAMFGIVGLALFAIVTRWEPSVLRAAVMAGFVLVVRAFGMSVGPWTALGGGVAGLLLVSGELVSDVGFQLSVAATAGVIAGSGYRPLVRLPLVGAALAATVSAQLAVAPLLLIHFGTLPLLSPLTNLLAGPLVMAATSLGGIGVLVGMPALTRSAIVIAGVVLGIARSAAPWPQIGWIGLGCLGFALVLARLPGPRRAMSLLAAAWAFIVIGLSPTPVALPAVVFLDVGQGDSSLFMGESGAVVLIDGGPDPGVLIERLRHYGVDHLDLVVASHQHHDHVAGLIAALSHFPVGRLWHSGQPDPGPEMKELLDLAERQTVAIEVVRPGWTATIGEFRFEVLGPVRRYASPNDQSVVLLVETGDRTILMPGDIETFAQLDLGPVHADILKVPHQGAATSDLNWLRSVGAEVAVIPVGPNDYGHPSPEVIEVFDAMGTQVLRTDRDGDVVISGR
jgi:competence protein ComEC